MSSEVRLGLTNILKRLADSYLTKGFGRHPIEHHVYDAVEVAPLYDWMPNPEQPNECGAGIKVTFFRQGQRVRWVEFAVRFTGGGGDQAIFILPT